MVVQQASTNSWYESARAAYNEPAKQKFLKDLAAALASNDSAVYAPPLRQIMRIGQAVGGDRLAQVLATALLRSADTTKDERLAEALLDLAANGSQVARDIVKGTSKTDSGYVVVRAWYQRLLDNCSYKVDYAVGKELSAISKRVDILKDAGFKAIFAPTNAEERISEIRAAIIGDEKHPEYASSRLAWFFVHGGEDDRLALRAAFREYSAYSGEDIVKYRRNGATILRGVVNLLNTEREFSASIKDKESSRKLSEALALTRSFFGGEAEVMQTAAPVIEKPVSACDQLRAELAKPGANVARLQKLAKALGEDDVLKVLSPMVASNCSSHVSAVNFVKLLDSAQAIQSLVDSASWSFESATALADLGTGRIRSSRSTQAAAVSGFWSAGNFAPIFRNPARYCALVKSPHPNRRGIFTSVEQAEEFARSHLIGHANLREALGVLYGLRNNGAIDVIRPVADRRTRALCELGAVMTYFVSSIAPERIRELSWEAEYDSIFATAVREIGRKLPEATILAAADFYLKVGSSAGAVIPRTCLATFVNFLPPAKQTECLDLFVNNGDWGILAKALIDWVNPLTPDGFQFEATFLRLKVEQIQSILDQLPNASMALLRAMSDVIFIQPWIDRAEKVAKARIVELRSS